MSAGTTQEPSGAAKLRRLATRAAVRVFGPELPGHYLPAFRARGRSTPYDPKRAWTSRYERLLEDSELDDASTIKRGANPLRVRYHYNAVENAVLEHALRHGFPERPAVLDVGAGSGHWIDFYRETLGARETVAVEISSSAARALAAAYAGTPGVDVVEADVADASFDLGRRFDVVSAVDVLFHVVDDAAWRRAVGALAAHLAPRGRIVVAEHVALVSHDAGFRRPNPERDEEPGRADTIVTKRVRSLRAWRECARGAGLSVIDSARIRKSRMQATPANRLLVLGHGAYPARAERDG